MSGIESAHEGLPRTELAGSGIGRVTMGYPAADIVAGEAARQGARRVFLLAGRHLAEQTGEITRIRDALAWRHVATHCGIRPHAPKADIVIATRAARDAGADMVVAVGGGSVIDAAKILILALRHGVDDLEGLDRLKVHYDEQGRIADAGLAAPDIPLVAVPATLSGGEFNTLAGAKDEALSQKHGFRHAGMAPVCVVLDPAITLHTPEWLFLSTGVRAIDHAVETLTSPFSNDYCDGLAESALRLLGEGLVRVKDRPGDLAARLRCQIGVWQSMTALAGGIPMGASHAIGHALGAVAGVPHGHTSCVMAPAVQLWNGATVAAAHQRIARALDAGDRPVPQVLDRLILRLGMPRTLAEVGVGPDLYARIAEKTLHDIWGRTNARALNGPDDVLAILRLAEDGSAWEGA
ncbi:iron-containing alcohol dehydrogenase [Niveispirillum fermenti]|uniref:iron-containing alcohol dehydrogenase n=1 Tax=Niveispirillum fermenti TaxID=1233113 RepID=UPI003A864799